MDYYMSPTTAQLADLVLPSTHWTERDYLADEVRRVGSPSSYRCRALYERRSDVVVLAHTGPAPASRLVAIGNR